MFQDDAHALHAADQLVSLACHHGFEGWLINIENRLTRRHVGVMQRFVAYLRARMRSVIGPNSMVIW